MPDVTPRHLDPGLNGLSVADVAALGSAALREARDRIGAIPAAIRPVTPPPAFAGPAATVAGPPGDNLWPHRALYEGEPGDVLAARVSGACERGYRLGCGVGRALPFRRRRGSRPSFAGRAEEPRPRIADDDSAQIPALWNLGKD